MLTSGRDKDKESGELIKKRGEKNLWIDLS